MPGFFELPVNNTFTSLILERLTNASVPIKAEFTVYLINDDASLRLNPDIKIFPISGRLIEPSPFIENFLS